MAPSAFKIYHRIELRLSEGARGPPHRESCGCTSEFATTRWLTLLKQRLLGGMGIVFDHFLLEMLRGVIFFLCTSFYSRYRHHCMKEMCYSKCFDAEKMVILDHFNAAS